MITRALLASTAIALAASAAQAETTIEVAYPYSGLFEVTFERIMPLFNEAHPDINVVFRTTYEHYEDGTNTILRETVADELPDITLQGLNRQLILVERGIARSLEEFIAQEPDFETEGYHQAMLDLSTFDGAIYGLPFAVSLPIGYYNMDILREAGWDRDLPTTWDEVIELCGMIKANTDHDAMFWGWNITGNWFFQALNWAQDNPVIVDGEVNFNNEAGLNALMTMQRLFDECDMRNFSRSEATTAFAAGQYGMLFWSTSSVGSLTRSIQDGFEMATGPWPSVAEGGGLPAGGNAAMLVSTSDDPEQVQAAWTFLRFITSGVGAAAIAETTGYMPPNQAANALLGDFYQENPNKMTALNQLPLLRDWIAYPGDNGLAITQVIYDNLESIVVGENDDMEELLEVMSEEVEDLL